MPRQNQFLFDYVTNFPEMAESLLREEVRKEARLIVHEAPFKANELIRESLMVASRSLAETAFFQCLEDPEDDLMTAIRRDATGRVLLTVAPLTNPSRMTQITRIAVAC